MEKKKIPLLKKTSFWENVKRSLAIFSGPTVYGLHELNFSDTTMLVAGCIAFAGAILSIWFVDNDNNGEIDLFQ